jgi:signal transduction histidine kinase
MLNLVSNAVAVMPAGGTVTLSSAQVGAQWQLEVVDEGPGLPPEQLTSMFERFAQLPRPAGGEAKGNGLGLAICRSIVRLHGGEITAANREDRSGLRLRVVLPA